MWAILKTLSLQLVRLYMIRDYLEIISLKRSDLGFIEYHRATKCTSVSTMSLRNRFGQVVRIFFRKSQVADSSENMPLSPLPTYHSLL